MQDLHTVAQIQHRNHDVLDYEGYMAPTLLHGLDHVDQGTHLP